MEQLDIFMCLTLLVDGVLVMDVGLAIFEVADKVEEDCVEAFEVEDEAAEVESAEDEPDETWIISVVREEEDEDSVEGDVDRRGEGEAVEADVADEKDEACVEADTEEVEDVAWVETVVGDEGDDVSDPSGAILMATVVTSLALMSEPMSVNIVLISAILVFIWGRSFQWVMI